MVAMSSPWKDPRTGIYYIRRGVPSNLQSQLDRTVYKRSLNTRDPNEAKSKFPLELAKCEKVFAQAKANLLSAPLKELPKEEIERLADAYISMVLEEDEEYRMDGLNEAAYRDYDETLNLMDATYSHKTPRGDTNLIEFEMEDFLDWNGIKVTKGSTLYRQLAYTFLQASAKANKLLLKRHQGEVVDTPVAPDVSVNAKVPSKSEGSISYIHEGWKRERKPEPKLESDSNKVIRRFIECHGDLPIEDITRRQVAKFKECLLQLPARPKKAIRELPLLEIIKLHESDTKVQRLTARTVRRDIGLLQTMCEWAVSNGYREDNPVTRVKVIVPKNESEKRLPYDNDDLKVIFNAPVFTENKRPIGGAGEAAYWIPILALYTGARLDELGQLLVTDIKQDDDDIWFFDFNLLDEGKSLKTISSKRHTPIHSEVIDLGFLDYVSDLKNINSVGQLFSELKPNAQGKLTSSYSKWYSRYVRGLGLTDKRKVFHSFRHTFKRTCRDAGIHEEVHDALTGHSGGGVGRSYGAGVSLSRLQEAINTLSFKVLLNS